MADEKTKPQGPSEAEEAEQKRFRIMAGAGALVVVVLAYFALTLGSEDVAEVTTAAPATDSTAAVAEVPVEPVGEAATPLPPGVSGGASSGGGGLKGGGGGGSRSGGGATIPAGADRKAAEVRYTSQGLPPRAAAALADSAARRGSASTSTPPPSNGQVRVARATSLMIGPGSGGSALTVPTGAELRLSGCEPHGSETWCRASVSGITGWVRQSDVAGGP